MGVISWDGKYGREYMRPLLELTDSNVRSRFVQLMYTPEGKRIIEKLWQETLEELRFANVQGILEDMKRM